MALICILNKTESESQDDWFELFSDSVSQVLSYPSYERPISDLSKISRQAINYFPQAHKVFSNNNSNFNGEINQYHLVINEIKKNHKNEYQISVKFPTKGNIMQIDCDLETSSDDSDQIITKNKIYMNNELIHYNPQTIYVTRIHTPMESFKSNAQEIREHFKNKFW